MTLNRGDQFRKVQGHKPGRTLFDLSYSKKMSGRMGYLYPMMMDEVIPGDVFDIGMEAVVRFAPMVAPVLHEIILKADWFYVPYRILYNSNPDDASGQNAWEQFITGGGLNTSAVTRNDLGLVKMNSNSVPVGKLWDHLGLPTGVTLSSDTGADNPLAFAGKAYYMIYNEYYRDPNLEAMVDLEEGVEADAELMFSNWDADYFTRSLPFQQRGTAPAVPVSGLTSALWPTGDFVQGSPATPITVNAEGANADTHLYLNNANARNNFENTLEHNTVNLATGTTINVNDFRWTVQLQRWLERNAVAGYRYPEFVTAHFGVDIGDNQLNRPDYIGGMIQPVQISEVLQTSKTEAGAPQGNLAGHGIMAGRNRIGRYHVKDYGLIMCIMSVQPRSAYQQGINRQWLRQTKYDFVHPEFVNLSEQGVLNEEIYLSAASATNTTIWGYIGRYDELRYKHDLVSGKFRETPLYTWHLGRIFGSLPSLSSTFGHVDPTTVTRCFAAPSEDHLYIHWGNKLKAIRPLPPYGNPGLADHTFGG